MIQYLIFGVYPSLRVKRPYSEWFWSAYSRIRTEYKGILRTSAHSVQMQENTDQNNSEYRHFLHSALISDFLVESLKANKN